MSLCSHAVALRDRMCCASLAILENVVGCGGSVGVVDVGWCDVGYVWWGCGLCGDGSNVFGIVVGVRVGVCVCGWLFVRCGGDGGEGGWDCDV